MTLEEQLQARDAIIAAQAKTIVALEARVAELEALLEALLKGGSGGGGRGSPPPSRKPSGRPRGGQRGHRGRGRSVPSEAEADAVVEHPLEGCPHCGGAVSCGPDVDVQWQLEAATKALQAVLHKKQKGWCSRCDKHVRARAPGTLSRTLYGPRAHATMASLRATMGQSVGDLQTFAETVWHRPMSSGQIVAMLDRVTQALVPTFWWLVSELAALPALHEDTTSWKVDGQRASLWVFGSRRMTVYWIDPSQSALVVRQVVGETMAGHPVTDGAPRFGLVSHAGEQRCLAHPLRKARDLMMLHPDNGEVQQMMGALHGHLQWMMSLHARRDELSASTWLQYRARARRVLLSIARVPYENAECVRMARRIEREVDLWVTYLWDESGEVEPTNNQAERDLRPAVIDRKRQQQSRSLRGVYREMVLRSVASTCQKLGVDLEQVLLDALVAMERDGPEAVASPRLQQALRDAAARSSANRPKADVVARPRSD